MKTINIISERVSRDLSVNKEEVQRINNFYWKEIKSKLISLEVPTIYIKEIGTLTVSKYKLYKLIHELISKARNVANLTYKEETKQSYYESTITTLKKCLIQRNLIAQQEYYELFTRNKDTSSESDQEC